MEKQMLNDWVIQKLNAHGMSMRELGRRTGVSHSTISAVLSGKQEPALDFYVKMAKAFDAVPEMLRVAGIVSEAGEDELTLAEWYEIGKQLSPADREEVINYALFRLQRQQRDPGAAASPDTEPI